MKFNHLIYGFNAEHFYVHVYVITQKPFLWLLLPPGASGMCISVWMSVWWMCIKIALSADYCCNNHGNNCLSLQYILIKMILRCSECCWFHYFLTNMSLPKLQLAVYNWSCFLRQRIKYFNLTVARMFK